MRADGRIVVADGGVDTAAVAAYERDRRDLVRRGIAVGGAAVCASSVPLLLRMRAAFAAAEGDAQLLEEAIALEQVAVFAYETAIRSGRARPAFERLLRRIADHEREHAEALTTALEDLGGSAPARPSSVADVDKVRKGLGDVRSQADIARFAIELETAAVAAYHDAQRKLRDAKLLQTGASIMASEGQHLVVLRQAVGRDAVPRALETGEE